MKTRDNREAYDSMPDQQDMASNVALDFTRTIVNTEGEIVEVHCLYDPDSLAGNSANTPRVKATPHWVSARHSIPAEVQLYDRLFSVENPGDEKEGLNFKSYLNPNSLEMMRSCRVELGLSGAQPGSRYQFERLGYFCADLESRPEALVFNRTVTLRDAWAKIVRGAAQPPHAV